MHQSVMTPSIGAELPDTAFYEPCFGQELEWIMLHALDQIRLRTESSYLRLTTTRIDQGLFPAPASEDEAETLRRQVVAGCYRLVDRRDDPDYTPGNVVNIFVSGAMVPIAMRASDSLHEQGVLANVFNVTGPGPLYNRFQECASGAGEHAEFLSDLLGPGERTAPIVTVVDGHPRSLAWLGGALGAPVYPLGVADFGQSGTQSQLYREHGIDPEGIAATCNRALGI
jgi:pyruvate dehydrogenase E1 component